MKTSQGSAKETSQKVEVRISRACLFTLVIYTPAGRRSTYLHQLVETILDNFPCRIIFVEIDPNASTFDVDMTNVISGRSSSAQGTAVECDQMIIRVSPDQLIRVPSIILPKIVPDLPLYLLWGQSPFGDRELFPYLRPYATRVIFDVVCADKVGLFCQEMQSYLDTLKVDIMDISWALTSNWRDLLIQLFDTQEKVRQLDDLKSVLIKYHGSKEEAMLHSSIRPIYLQGWLASCLGWNYHSAETHEDTRYISYAGKNHPVVIALVPEYSPNNLPGSIVSIEINTASGDSYSLQRKMDLGQVLVHASTKETCPLPYTLPLADVHRGMGFMREIFFNKLGNQYRDMIKIVSQIDHSIFL